MAKMKLTLGPLPDFKLPVSFVLPNGDEQVIIFTVRHKKASEIHERYTAEKPMSDVEMITFLASGWDLEDEFNEENVAKLLDYYPSASLSLTGHYMKALAGQRVKN
ncbi:tail length tape measure protein [Shigella phage JK16]|uniref:TfmA n=1 Tax=Shigella phage JK16 TaxID=2591057 RepID=A0A5B9MZJ4_9CAUD|nr:tail length tape measure protein [Shigella phage JK16]QEG05024.1 TfmA [Shigella phage JK16]